MDRISLSLPQGAPCTTLLLLDSQTVRLARCEACGGISDRYVEHDSLFLLLDLLLHRVSAYRHLLCNHPLVQQGSHATLWRVGVALAVCDVHLKRTTQAAVLGESSIATAADAMPTLAPSPSLRALALSLAWPLASSALEFAAFTYVASAVVGGAVGVRRVAVALGYSSLGKALLVLSMIWEFPLPVIFGAAVEAFTLSCNVVALRVVHEQGGRVTPQRAVAAVAAAAAARTLLALVLVLGSPT